MPPTTGTRSEGISPTYPQGHFGHTKRALLRMMQQGHNVSFVGPAGCGKTHLLRTITSEGSLDIPDVPLPVYLDLRPLRRASEEEHFAHLAEALVRALRRAGSGRSSEAGDPRVSASVSSYLLAMLAGRSFRGIRVCYALDHFEYAARNTKLDAGFFGLLRSLCSRPDVSFICATRTPLWQFERLASCLGSPFPNVFLTWAVSAGGGL